MICVIFKKYIKEVEVDKLGKFSGSDQIGLASENDSSELTLLDCQDPEGCATRYSTAMSLFLLIPGYSFLDGESFALLFIIPNMRSISQW